MTPRWPVTALGALLLAGCALQSSSSESDRYASADGYSVELPAGWMPSRERGSTVFHAQGTKRTVVVRVAPRSVDGTPRPEAAIQAATRAVVQGLPGASIDREQPITGSLAGRRFSTKFTPTGVDRLYRREHVVLWSAERIYHVIMTAPASERVDEAALARLVSSLREEV
jgi:hypothetical protein